MTLQSKLVASYVVLGLCIALMSVLGGRLIQSAASRQTSYRENLLRRTSDVAGLADSASEEGFAFVLAGDPNEKARAYAKLDAAALQARPLALDPRLSADERDLLQRMVNAVETLRSAARHLFDEFDRTQSVSHESYVEYESAIDGVSDAFATLESQTRDRYAHDRLVAERTSDVLTILGALAAIAVAAAFGMLFSRRVTKPVLALRDAAVRFGAGQRDVAVPRQSDDELGELTLAFEAMMIDTRRHTEIIEHGQQHLRDVFASIEEILVVCDPDGVVIAANPACCRVSGLAENAILGTLASSLFSFSTARSLAPTVDTDAVLRTANGKEVPIRLSMSRLRTKGADGWVCVGQDLTQRRRLEVELRQAQKMEAIGRLAGGVAHDFNNMLSIVLGYSSMLLENLPPSDPMYEALREIQIAGERSADLTQQLLAFSRQPQRETDLVDLNDVLRGTGRMVRRVLRENIEVTIVQCTEICATELAAGQIEQVLMNLVVNARDAMPSGGKLKIEARVVDVGARDAAKHNDLRPGRYATLAVSDDGTGMDAETQDHIFEPFFTTKEQGKGTGLGLSTVFGIVHQCGGYIEVASTLGGGSVFTLYFPEASRVRATAEVRVLATAPNSGSIETILLVEDEITVRNLVERVLVRKGYRVLAAESSEDALAICGARGGEIDLLLTDVIMPQMNGPQLAERVVDAFPRIKVLYMSGYTDDIVLDGGMKTGGALLEKPISPEPLLRKVQQALALAPVCLAG